MTDSMITRNTVVAIAEGIMVAHLEGDAILLDIESGHYFGLNDVGERIIDLVQEPVAVNVVTNTLLKEYDVGARQLENDVTSFLQEMWERQLVRVMHEVVA